MSVRYNGGNPLRGPEEQPAYPPIPLTLTPGQTDVAPTALAWPVFSFVIYNQSNCWLKYGQAYISNPWQNGQVYVVPAGDAQPEFSLTGTAPPGQVNQANVKGSCTVQLLAGRLDPTPGVISYALQVTQNLRPTGTYLVPSATGLNTSITLQPDDKALIFITGFVGVSIVVTGHTSGFIYGTLTSPTPSNVRLIFPVDPLVDSQVDLVMTFAGVGTATVYGEASPINPAEIIQAGGGSIFPLGSAMADGESNATAVTRIGARLEVFNGTTWNRDRGTARYGGIPTWVDKTVSYAAAAVGPHGNTNRWTYTVPAGKVAIVEQLLSILIRDTATATPANAVAFVNYTPNGLTAVQVVRATQNTLGVVGQMDKDRANVFSMQAGDVLAAQTLDGSTGGAYTYTIEATIRELTIPY